MAQARSFFSSWLPAAGFIVQKKDRSSCTCRCTDDDDDEEEEEETAAVSQTLAKK